MISSKWYESWFDSEYYHQLYFNRDENEAADFINNLISYLNPPVESSILDMACGKGRHAKQLADKGFNVTGVDLSFNSIKEAKESENDHLHFFQHDMRQPFQSNSFDYCFNFFTSFGYFESRKEHYDAMKTMTDSLKKDGILVIDYLNVHYAEDHLQPQKDIILDDLCFHIKKWMDQKFFYKKIEITDKTQTEQKIFAEKVRKFSLEDFTDMLSLQEMQIQEVFGDYQLHPYDIRRSPRMIMISKKRK